jgi:hypothetical protein
VAVPEDKSGAPRPAVYLAAAALSPGGGTPHPAPPPDDADRDHGGRQYLGECPADRRWRGACLAQLMPCPYLICSVPPTVQGPICPAVAAFNGGDPVVVSRTPASGRNGPPGASRSGDEHGDSRRRRSVSTEQ